MLEIFKTVLMLSLLGGGVTAILLILKPITSKRLPAKWQYYIWLTVIVCMSVPVWKCIPQSSFKTIISPTVVQNQQLSETEKETEKQTVIIENTPMEYRKILITSSESIGFYDFTAYIWLCGMFIFLILSFGSYFIFLLKKRKKSVPDCENAVLIQAIAELNITRKIKLRISKDEDSPMLVGVLFPVIYLPSQSISGEKLRMIFLHELMHFKRGDLIYKWISLFVNAVHWFNPLAYMLSANICESCEVSCDMEVIKDMTKDEQTLYMKTILDLVQNEDGGK